MIGRGIIKTDDYIKFGRIVDELSKYCYIINYIPSTDRIVICFHKSKLSEIASKFTLENVVKPKRGVLAFAKVRWR